MVDDFVEEEFEELDEEVNMIEGDTSYVHLTQDEYEKSLSFNQYFDEEDNKNQTEMSSSQYRLFSDALQDELHKKYDLDLEKMELKQIIKVNQTKSLIKTKEKKCQP
jgi:hypothetical protein